MNVSLKKSDDVNGIITVQLEKADYQDKVDKALNSYRQKVNMPGFRQGKVPKGIMQKMYGEAVTAEELNKIINDQLIKFIKDNDLNILGEPLAMRKDEPTKYCEQEKLEFNFKVGLTPEYDLNLNKKDTIPYYKVNLEDDLLEKQITAYKSNYGTYKQVDEKSVESDLLKGTLTELENGEPKENGKVIEKGIIMPSYIKDEETKNSFIGISAGKEVIINPHKAYADNESEIASFLQIKKDEVKNINSDFKFSVNEITRFEEAENGQELYDKVFGEGVVTSEEDFRTKLRENLNDQFKPSSDYLFMKDAETLIQQKLENVTFPEEFLKEFLISTKEDSSPEKIEEDFPKILRELKFHLAKEKILKDENIKIDDEELESVATDFAKTQFAQYGMTNVPLENLQGYAKSLLNNEDSARNIYDIILNRKIQDYIMGKVKIDEKIISSEEMNSNFKK